MPKLRQWFLCLSSAWLVACGGGGADLAESSIKLANPQWTSDAGQTLTFEGIAAIQGFAGCNTYRGQAVLDTSRITLTPQLLTNVYCTPGVDSQSTTIMDGEASFLNALKSASHWRIDQGRLVLLDAQGNAVLSLKTRS